MREFLLRRQALSAERIEALCEALLRSPLVGRSTLAGSFRESRGFALTFTGDEGAARVRARFAELGGFLSLALGEPHALRAWPMRLFARERGAFSNAWYLNLLILPPGAHVGRHTDATLRGPSGVADAVPHRVSVLYLRVPPGVDEAHGALKLYRGERLVANVRPEPGALLHFRGDLQHEVTPVPVRAARAGGDDDAVRVSLVCEQYRFEPDALTRLPTLQVQSKAGFGAYLNIHRDREQ